MTKKLFSLALLVCTGLFTAAYANEPFRSISPGALAKPEPVITVAPCLNSEASNGECVRYTEGRGAGCPQALRGWLYKPLSFFSGPRPAIIWNHGKGEPGEQLALANFYTSHGYVFFTPHRTGQGLSASAGQSLAEREPECDSGPHRNECKVVLHEQANADVVSAVEWLRKQSFVDRNRIAMSGLSAGGIQTILTAQKGLHLRAFVSFAAGAIFWGNTALRYRLLNAVIDADQPIFVIQAANDYDTGPSELLGPYLETVKGGANKATLYPAFGSGPEDGHGRFATSYGGIAIWGDDVLAFLKAVMD